MQSVNCLGEKQNKNKNILILSVFRRYSVLLGWGVLRVIIIMFFFQLVLVFISLLFNLIVYYYFIFNFFLCFCQPVIRLIRTGYFGAKQQARDS